MTYLFKPTFNIMIDTNCQYYIYILMLKECIIYTYILPIFFNITIKLNMFWVLIDP